MSDAGAGGTFSLSAGGSAVTSIELLPGETQFQIYDTNPPGGSVPQYATPPDGSGPAGGTLSRDFRGDR